MKNIIISSVKMLILTTLITGIIYPLFISGVSTVIFSNKADGSFIFENNKIVGSSLIGQKFESNKYFASRPSAIDYNPLPSGGSNLGPTSKQLLDSVIARKERFIKLNNTPNNCNISNEILFSSGSGVDPHISPSTALLQVKRIASERNMNEAQLKKIIKLIERMTEAPQLGFLGEERINTLLLNIELDKIK